MTAILTGTILVGILTTRILYMIHLNVFAIRYGVAVIAAYGAFVGFVKLWLVYVGYCAARASARSGGDSWFDSFNFSSGGSSSGSTGGSSSFSGGGGKFGGGGASGDWGEGSPANSNMIVAPVQSSSASSSSYSAGSGHSGSSSKSGGGGLDLGDDLGELILVVLIIALVFAILLSFLWMVWAAPGILGETAFNAVLAGALSKHAHRASNGSWVGSVFKKTALPFIGILALAITMGWWAQHYCPNALRLMDALPCVK